MDNTYTAAACTCPPPPPATRLPLPPSLRILFHSRCAHHIASVQCINIKYLCVYCTRILKINLNGRYCATFTRARTAYTIIRIYVIICKESETNCYVFKSSESPPPPTFYAREDNDIILCSRDGRGRRRRRWNVEAMMIRQPGSIYFNVIIYIRRLLRAIKRTIIRRIYRCLF